VQRFSLQCPSEKARASDREARGVTIVLIEDNPADVTLVREALEEHGVEGELIVASDGEKAMQVIQDIDCETASCPDLFIVDLNIPKRPGREVLECMRQSAKCSGTAVAILSSSDSARDREDAKRLGVSHYIKKPSRLDEFLGLGEIFKALLSKSSD